MSDATQPILKAEHLGITFGGLKAVSNFNMTINKGELIGLIGPNGAGKTTVFNLLTGVYKPTEGRVPGWTATRMNGKKTYQVVRAGIARTFQNIRLFKQLTVEENVLVAFDESFTYHMGSAIFRTPGFWKQENEMHEKAIDLLRIFNLEGLATTQAANLPYGQQRKLEIRTRPGHRHETAAARRAGRRHEPHRNRGSAALHQHDPRPFRYRHPAHRT